MLYNIVARRLMTTLHSKLHDDAFQVALHSTEFCRLLISDPYVHERDCVMSSTSGVNAHVYGAGE